MIEVCYCSPNMKNGQSCNYCQAKQEIISRLQNLLVEFTEEDFDRIFSNYNIGPRARLTILAEIEDNEYAG